jgi:hypothetical protein
LTKKPNKVLTEKKKLDVDKKKHNYVLKKKKKKETTSQNTVLTPTPLQNPPHNPKRSGVCVSTTVP